MTLFYHIAAAITSI